MMVPGSISGGLIGKKSGLAGGTGKYMFAALSGSSVYTLHKRNGPTSYVSLGSTVTVSGILGFNAPEFSPLEGGFASSRYIASPQASYLDVYKFLQGTDTFSLAGTLLVDTAGGNRVTWIPDGRLVYGVNIYNADMSIVGAMPAFTPGYAPQVLSFSPDGKYAVRTSYLNPNYLTEVLVRSGDNYVSAGASVSGSLISYGSTWISNTVFKNGSSAALYNVSTGQVVAAGSITTSFAYDTGSIYGLVLYPLIQPNRYLAYYVSGTTRYISIVELNPGTLILSALATLNAGGSALYAIGSKEIDSISSDSKLVALGRVWTATKNTTGSEAELWSIANDSFTNVGGGWKHAAAGYNGKLTGFS